MSEWSRWFSLDPTRPIYSQIVDGIVRRVVRGELAAGAALPSVRLLAEELRVNPNTVQRAYRELERLGVAESYPGQGVHVCRNPGAIATVRRSLAAEVVERAVADLVGLGLEPDAILRMVSAELERQRKGVEP